MSGGEDVEAGKRFFERRRSRKCSMGYAIQTNWITPLIGLYYHDSAPITLNSLRWAPLSLENSAAPLNLQSTKAT